MAKGKSRANREIRKPKKSPAEKLNAKGDLSTSATPFKSQTSFGKRKP